MFGFLKKLKEKSKLSLTDPVCGMQANVNITAQYQDQTYGFCSDHCRQEFAKAPERYSKK